MFSIFVFTHRSLSVAALALVLATCTVRAQTTTFTYQGRLTDSGNPANGSYDLQCALFGALSGGSQIGSALTHTSVAVNSGVFAVQLDFGVNAFPGADRFLEISVRPHSSDPSIPPYVLLTPRQQISSTPYAIRTLSAATADTATNATQLGGLAANQYVQTNDPRLTDARPPVAGSSNYVQNGTSPQAGANFNIGGGGTIGGNLLTSGQVGIGTTTPTEKLQVAGVIQSTTGGFKFPDGTLQTTAVAASPVNRVLRGVISISGAKSEFSASFSAFIDPSKSFVLLSEAVNKPGPGSGLVTNAVALVSLSASSITVAVGNPTTQNLSPYIVSYQIIEYK